MNLNNYIEVAETLPATQQQKAIIQDNEVKTNFALRMMERLPQGQAQLVELPKIPSLGALAVAN